MQENPYAAFAQTLRTAAQPTAQGWLLGEVMSVYPLVVSAGGIENLAGNDLLVNADLLPGYTFKQVQTQTLKGTLNGTVDCRTGSITALSVSDGNLSGSWVSQASPLSVGDLVVLLPSSDGQQYIVLCKVVSV